MCGYDFFCVCGKLGRIVCECLFLWMNNGASVFLCGDALFHGSRNEKNSIHRHQDLHGNCRNGITLWEYPRAAQRDEVQLQHVDHIWANKTRKRVSREDECNVSFALISNVSAFSRKKHSHLSSKMQLTKIDHVKDFHGFVIWNSAAQFSIVTDGQIFNGTWKEAHVHVREKMLLCTFLSVATISNMWVWEGAVSTVKEIFSFEFALLAGGLPQQRRRHTFTHAKLHKAEAFWGNLMYGIKSQTT